MSSTDPDVLFDKSIIPESGIPDPYKTYLYNIVDPNLRQQQYDSLSADDKIIMTNHETNFTIFKKYRRDRLVNELYVSISLGNIKNFNTLKIFKPCSDISDSIILGKCNDGKNQSFLKSYITIKLKEFNLLNQDINTVTNTLFSDNIINKWPLNTKNNNLTNIIKEVMLDIN